MFCLSRGYDKATLITEIAGECLLSSNVMIAIMSPTYLKQIRGEFQKEIRALDLNACNKRLVMLRDTGGPPGNNICLSI